jgi:hypothetical protein
MSVEKTRNWLTKNKVFFEIFSSSLLGFAALFVGYASYQVSEAQLQVSRVATEPLFYIETILFKNTESQKYDEKELRIYNAGAPVYNISTRSYTFININLLKSEHSKSVYIPINGYFDMTFSTHAPKELIATLRGHNNNYHAARISKLFLERSEKNQTYIDNKLITITTVSYRNALNEDHKIAFLDRNIVKIEEVMPLIKIHENSHLLELSTITPESLLKAASDMQQSE